LAPQEDRSTNDEQLEFSFDEPAPSRCGSCGAPVSHGDLCLSCEKAFSAVLGQRAATTDYAAIASEPSTSPEALSDANESDDVAPTDVTPAATSAAAPVQAAARDRIAVGAVGAVLIAVVVGLPIGARWLQQQAAAEPPAPHRAAAIPPSARQPSPPAVTATATNVTTEPKTTTPTPLRNANAAVRAIPVQTPSRRQPATTTPPRRATTTAAKVVRPPSAASAPSAAPSSATTVDTPTVTVPSPPSAPASAAPSESQPVVAPEAPAGRFFDAPEVDEQPRILTRIDPRLPADLQGRPSDVVIVRVLVSHTGHPFRVTLLRRSRLGPSADEAVIAAVRRWTFSAARKRGEPVSCWYNLAVPLSVG
jgi:hypothetical protein